MSTIILGMPHYGQIHARAARSLWGTASIGEHRCLPGALCGSLLPHTFNIIWHSSLELGRREGAKYFCMLHADVAAQPGWVDLLVEEIEDLRADVVSVVIPIKDGKGLTSTAIDDPEDEFTPYRRLTMREVMELPETFSAGDLGHGDRALLVNTGCWIADLGRAWCDDVNFELKTEVRRRPDGTSMPCCAPEDWNFSRFLHRRGAAVYATRKVSVSHHGGDDGYPNDRGWGQWRHDEFYAYKHGGTDLAVAAGMADRARSVSPVEAGVCQNSA